MNVKHPPIIALELTEDLMLSAHANALVFKDNRGNVLSFPVSLDILPRMALQALLAANSVWVEFDDPVTLLYSSPDGKSEICFDAEVSCLCFARVGAEESDNLLFKFAAHPKELVGLSMTLLAVYTSVMEGFRS